MRVRLSALPACLLVALLVPAAPGDGATSRGLWPGSPSPFAQIQPIRLHSHRRAEPSIVDPSPAGANLRAGFQSGPALAPPYASYAAAVAAEEAPPAAVAPVERPARTCVVSSTADKGNGSLRACLLNAAAGDTITFDAAVFPPGAPQSILLASELPPIIVNNLTIDGSNAGVIVDGSRLTGNSVGLRIDGRSGVVVRGLQIRRFGWGMVLWSGAKNCTIGGDRRVGSGFLGQGNLISGNAHSGIELSGAGTNGNTVLGNFIGTNVAGTGADGNRLGMGFFGGASRNAIGGRHTPGVCDGPCNVISANLDGGIGLQDDGTDDNRILGNFIGTDVSGTRAIANLEGVTVARGASTTQIGGLATGEGNLVSGNTDLGIWISWADAVGTEVWGNLIGTDVTGEVALPNYDGIVVVESTETQIGGAEAGAGNLISGNEYAGIVLDDVGAPGNAVTGNRIGTNGGGTVALPNYRGLILTGADNNVIGGTATGAGNLISGNTSSGVIVAFSDLNSLLGNLVGTDLTGELAIPNGSHGVEIHSGSSSNQVGGSEPGTGNLISGNDEDGVYIADDDTLDDRVVGNRIGTNRAGTAALPNGWDGVTVLGAPGTVVGGAHTPWVCDGACNLISGNGVYGVLIQGLSTVAAASSDQGAAAARTDRPAASAQDIQVFGNFIGTDLAGTLALPNADGIVLLLQAAGNRIGSGTSGEGNLISGNTECGVVIEDPGTTENRVLGNRIGTTANGEAALPNEGLGLLIAYGAQGNFVGGEGTGEGNLISGNAKARHEVAVQIQNAPEAGVTGNSVIGNLIGTDWSGMRAIPNSAGILLLGGPTETQIRRNVISGNVYEGIVAASAGTSHNTLAHNLIGVAVDGQTSLPNMVGVAFIGADHNTVGPANTIAENSDYGVVLSGAGAIGNTISQSRVYDNGDRQIVFLDVSAPLAPAPVLSTWDGLAGAGTACAGCLVEIFSASRAEEGGRSYLGTSTAGATGAFSFTGGSGAAYLTATATDSVGTTSPFAAGLFVGYAVYLPIVLGFRSNDRLS